MEYQPGVCNIGRAERRKRLGLGVASLIAAIAFVAGVVAAGWPTWTLLLSAVAFYGVAMGVLQYRAGFCVGFAVVGAFDVGDGSREITDPQALEADRKRAVLLNAKALTLGAAGALVTYLVGLRLL